MALAFDHSGDLASSASRNRQSVHPGFALSTVRLDMACCAQYHEQPRMHVTQLPQRLHRHVTACDLTKRSYASTVTTTRIGRVRTTE